MSIQNIQNIQNLECLNNCCHYMVTPYRSTYYSNNIDQIQTKIKKAGSFVYNSRDNKVLLVQSRGQMWGPPKGTLKKGEEPLECAIREVKEETGLDLDSSKFSGSMIIRSKAQYYFMDFTVDINESIQIQIQTHIEDNDANGIGWFHIECLNDLVKNGVIFINQHCRILIKKIFNYDISFNKE
jgi:8-oxo-dGTP pyrophosphatase MutT (NUDIX family)